MEMNKIALQYVLLSYPNFIEIFIIQADRGTGRSQRP